MSNFFKQTSQVLKKEVKKSGKQIVGEVAEIPKQVVRPGNVRTNQPSPIVEAMQQKSDISFKNAPISEKTRKARLDYLQRELEVLKRRKEYEQRQSMIIQAQEEKQKEEKSKPPIIVEAPSKRRIGLPFFGRKKVKGTGEVIKTPK